MSQANAAASQANGKPAATPCSSHRLGNGQFAKGHAGGPGRPRLALGLGALELDRLGLEAAQELIGAVIDQARLGNLRAAEMVLARVWPARRERPLAIAAAPQAEPYDNRATALAAVTRAVLEGELTPREGRAVARLLEDDMHLSQRIESQKEIAALAAHYDRERQK